MRKVFLTPEDIRTQAERTYRHFTPSSVRQKFGIGSSNEYTYVFGYAMKDNGRVVFVTDGPMDQQKAEQIGSMLIEGRTITLSTRDLKKAKGIIAAEVAEREKSFTPALQRKYTQIIREKGDKHDQENKIH